jgi:hypothetical protein
MAALTMGAEKPRSLLSSSCGDDSSPLYASASGATASYGRVGYEENGSSKVVENVSKS